MKKLILAATLAAAFGNCFAAPQELAPPAYAEARSQFFAGADGDAKARDAAIESFKALSASLPGHPLFAAHEGAAVAMQGRDALMPWNKMKLAEAGANAIEKALAQLTPAHDEALFNGVPESLETRLVAASTLLAMPEIMNRAAMGKKALDAVLNAPFLAKAPSLKARALGVAAQQAGREKRSADEIKLLKEVLSLVPAQASQGQQAAARLKELGA